MNYLLILMILFKVFKDMIQKPNILILTVSRGITLEWIKIKQDLYFVPLKNDVIKQIFIYIIQHLKIFCFGVMGRQRDRIHQLLWKYFYKLATILVVSAKCIDQCVLEFVISNTAQNMGCMLFIKLLSQRLKF